VEEQRPAWYEVPAQGTAGAPTSLLERVRERPVTIAGLAVAATLIVALAGIWVAGSAASPTIDLGPIAAQGSADPSPDEAMLVVDVAGAVRAPGLYRLPAGARIGDAIAAAGGFGPAVDAGAVALSLNLAARLTDGEKVIVPARGGATDPPDGSASSPGLVDLNHATEAELDALPGIGPVTAKKIIASRTERPFSSAQELLDRKLVWQATWEKIRELVTAG
jgi:competence protein ComEA